MSAIWNISANLFLLYPADYILNTNKSQGNFPFRLNTTIYSISISKVNFIGVLFSEESPPLVLVQFIRSKITAQIPLEKKSADLSIVSLVKDGLP